MAFYLIFTLLMGFVVLFNRKGKRIGYLLLFILFFLSAFRGDEVGHDTLNYMDADYIKHRGTTLTELKNFEITDFGSQLEVLNNYMCKIIYELQLNPRFLIVFYSLIMMIFLSLSARKFQISLPFLLSFFVLQGLYLESFNVARQLCATSVILYAVSFLKYRDKRRNSFFIWMTVATLLHSFSAIFFFLYFFYKIPKLPDFVILLLYFSCLMLSVLKIDFISNISLLMSSDKIASYMDNYGGDEGLNIIGILYTWIYITILYYFYLVYTKKCDYDYSLGQLYVFSLVVYSAVVNYGGIIGRIHFGFSIIQPVILTIVFAHNIKRLSSIDKLVFLAYLLIACYNSTRKAYMLEHDYYMCIF